MRKYLFLLIGVILFGAGQVTGQSEEPECAFPEATTVASALDIANIVFVGEFVDLNTNWVSGGYKLTFKVDQSWVRTTEPFITVNFPVNATCEIPFKKGEKYLVFVYKKFSLKTDCCMPNLPLSQAGPALSELGESFPPSDSPGTQSLPIIMTILTIGGLELVLFVVLRKGKGYGGELRVDLLVLSDGFSGRRQLYCLRGAAV